MLVISIRRKNRVEVSDSQQTELLEKEQTALNRFVEKMEQELKT